MARTHVLITGLVLALAASGSAVASTDPVRGPLLATVGSADTGVTRITASVSQCGSGWSSPYAGPQTFAVQDTDSRPGEVLLTTASGGIVGYAENLGTGSVANLRVDLAPGRYTFRCVMEDADTVVGPVVVVRPPAVGGSTTPPVKVVTEQDLIPPTLAYERYVQTALPSLLAKARRLRRDIATGRIAEAKQAWLAAHLIYERLGAAYGAFGPIDAAIDGLPNGLPRGLHDVGFTGFHRIEYGLWRNRPASVLRVARVLVRDVRILIARFRSAQIDPLEFSIRAHEIVENTLQFTLTGEDDFGSNSQLATARANLAGTTKVLRLLHPLLVHRYARLGALQHQLSQTRQDLATLAAPDGLPGLADLSRAQHERIDSDFSELTELLAPVASICEPRRD